VNGEYRSRQLCTAVRIPTLACGGDDDKEEEEEEK
jgi:hypothetical protein